jgi:hypothetical protein
MVSPGVLVGCDGSAGSGSQEGATSLPRPPWQDPRLLYAGACPATPSLLDGDGVFAAAARTPPASAASSSPPSAHSMRDARRAPCAVAYVAALVHASLSACVANSSAIASALESVAIAHAIAAAPILHSSATFRARLTARLLGRKLVEQHQRAARASGTHHPSPASLQ